MEITRILREEIERAGKNRITRYRIAAETGVDPAVIHRLVHGIRSVHIESAERLLTYFGYKLIKSGGKVSKRKD